MLSFTKLTAGSSSSHPGRRRKGKKLEPQDPEIGRRPPEMEPRPLRKPPHWLGLGSPRKDKETGFEIVRKK